MFYNLENSLRFRTWSHVNVLNLANETGKSHKCKNGKRINRLEMCIIRCACESESERGDVYSGIKWGTDAIIGLPFPLSRPLRSFEKKSMLWLRDDICNGYILTSLPVNIFVFQTASFVQVPPPWAIIAENWQKQQLIRTTYRWRLRDPHIAKRPLLAAVFKGSSSYKKKDARTLKKESISTYF